MRVTNFRKLKSMKEIIIRRNNWKPLPEFHYMLKFDLLERLLYTTIGFIPIAAFLTMFPSPLPRSPAGRWRLDGHASSASRANLRTCQRKSVKRTIECAFLRRCSSLLVPSYVPICREMLRKAKFDLWWPLVTWSLTWPKTWLREFLHDFWRSFEYRLPCVATWARSRVRGGVQIPPARRGLTKISSKVHSKMLIPKIVDILT